MGFPFINKPFDGWVRDKLDARAKNRIELNRLTPFIWMTSGACVSSGKNTRTVSDSIGSAQYNGCVISNHIDIATKYSLENTILGYDLNGKLIKVPGEAGRKISPPIIESMDIDTDGENNTLKTANINIVLFSLKQLEMFELFFLKPTMTVVLEYGNISMDTKTKIQSNSFIGSKNWTTFKEEIVNNYSPKTDTYLKYRDAYLTRLKETNGDYDCWIAKVTKFNVEFDSAENVYKVLLEVSSGNELHLWMPIDQQSSNEKDTNNSSRVPKINKNNDPTAWMAQLCSELGLGANLTNKLIKAAPDYKNEFFNWGIANTRAEDNTYSKEPYISFKLILDIMNDVEVFKAYKQKINPSELQGPTGDSNKPNGDIIPVSSHKNIISTNVDFILPGTKLPKFKVNPAKPSNVIIDDKETYSGTINGKSFNINYGDTDVTKMKALSGEEVTAKGVIGNLLNVFIRKDKFVRTFKDVYTFSDFYEIMLGLINDFMYGLCKLEIGVIHDTNTVPMTIIDKKIRQIPTTDIKPYRFKLNPIESIVHSVSFNLEMSNLMQAQALYESQLALYEKTDKEPKNAGAAFVEDKHFMKMIGQTNLDNLYSVDAINYYVLKAAEGWQVTSKKDDDVPKTKPTKKEEQEQLKEASIANTKKYVKFKKDKNSKSPDLYHLIYEDYNFVQSKISIEVPQTSLLTYIECEIVIDGISGIRCGELFQLDGIPEIYNQNGAFQILNIKQNIAPDTGWRTTINAGFRYNVPAAGTAVGKK